VEAVSRYVKLAAERYKKNLVMPLVHFDVHDSRGGYHQAGAVHYNPTLAAQNFTDYMETTVPHEAAHYIQWQVFPSSLMTTMFRKRRKIHGREWQSVMRLLGANPARCHHYDVSAVPMRRKFKRFPVYCKCPQPHQVTVKIINKLQAGKKYTCYVCHSQVFLTNQLTPANSVVSFEI
jgi:SprT protein